MSADEKVWTSKITKKEDGKRKNGALTQKTVFQLKDLAEEATSDDVEPVTIRSKFQEISSNSAVYFDVSMLPRIKHRLKKETTKKLIQVSVKVVLPGGMFVEMFEDHPIYREYFLLSVYLWQAEESGQMFSTLYWLPQTIVYVTEVFEEKDSEWWLETERIDDDSFAFSIFDLSTLCVTQSVLTDVTPCTCIKFQGVVTLWSIAITATGPV